tara:strand:- start:5 stop:532 length:528 start_codon:yes stop_codon:yes gene_type:complete
MTDYKALYEQQQQENEELIEGKEVLSKAYKENKIEIMKLKEENEKLQEDLLMAINTDDIAEIAGEDKEYYRDVCCAHTLGNMILENKKLKEEIAHKNNKFSEWIEENKKLQKELSRHRLALGNLDEENKKLKKENKKLKEERKIIMDNLSQDPALMTLLPDSMYDAGVDSDSSDE